MQLPSLILKKVTYEYEDGSRYSLEGKGLEQHQEQIARASFSAMNHGEQFDELPWVEEVKVSYTYNKEKGIAYQTSDEKRTPTKDA